ncbi:MAG: hypothetical protein RIR01_316 [Bacteroidota bacterium]|jgi:hypothetical protein
MTKFSLLKRDKNPRGGLTASGRARYNRATGGNLRPPVKSRPDTLTEYRRKGSFLVRMGSSQGRLFDAKGRKTRLKLSLEAWGYKGKSKSEAVALGRRYLRAYQNKKK